MSLRKDPLENTSIAEYGRMLRSGRASIQTTVEAYLDRIEALDPRLSAFEHVASESALATAAAMDRLLRAGTDLGPLMGVPVAVKDLFAVDGMPTRAGSNLDIQEIVGSEGPFIGSLRRRGAIILGKVKTVEFALGAVGTNAIRGTPWNPHDASTPRIPGGSSSGPAVAVAAGLCAFAVGSDTGGSVRLPAALCGIFGLKATAGLWPVEGIFPLSPTLDSLGVLTRSAADASTVFHALNETVEQPPARMEGLRLGKPTGYFYDDLDEEVASCVSSALERLLSAGARLIETEVPQAAEREAIFPTILPTELLATLGRARFEQGRERMDPVVAARLDRGLTIPADQYIAAVARQRELVRIAEDLMSGLDGWITPAAALVAPPVDDFADLEKALKLAFSITKSSQPINLFGQCGVSLPIHHLGSNLPVGLQIACSPRNEDRLLSLALAVEQVLGIPEPPDLSTFLSHATT